MKKTVPCQLEGCNNQFEAQVVGGMWRPTYCPRCRELKVWMGRRNLERRRKELDAQ